MTFQKPSLTIFIATHNRSTKLKRVLEFINKDALETNCRNEIEIVVSDNNSKDKTINICQSMKSDGSINAFFSNKKMGVK